MCASIVDNKNLPVDKSGVQLKYQAAFSDKKYQLFECTADLTDMIMNGEQKLVIKNFHHDDMKSMAAVCTSSETYKIKKCENTSQMYVIGQDDVNSSQFQIEHMSQIHIEISKSKTKTYQLLAILSNYQYNTETKSSISRQNLLNQCQVSENEFTELLQSTNFNQYLRIYEIEPDRFCLFEIECLYELLDDLIVLINGKIHDEIVSIDAVMDANEGIIRSKFTQNDIVFALRHLAEETDSMFKLSVQKMQKAIALKVLDFKGDGYRLREFVEVLKQAYELGIPVALQNSSMAVDFDAKENLYENFSEMDLRCLIGHAVIIPYQHQRVHERSSTEKDDIIIALHPQFNQELAKCMENVEARIEVLFKIKEKWTARELKQNLKDFCDPDVEAKFDVWLNKNTRIFKDQNPYEKASNQILYMKKF